MISSIFVSNTAHDHHSLLLYFCMSELSVNILFGKKDYKNLEETSATGIFHLAVQKPIGIFHLVVQKPSVLDKLYIKMYAQIILLFCR